MCCGFLWFCRAADDDTTHKQSSRRNHRHIQTLRNIVGRGETMPVTPSASVRPMTRETSIESKQESLRAVLYVFVAHQLMNAIVLGPWNSMRCLYWYVISCNGAAHVHRIELTRERERERHDVLRCVLFCFVLLCFLFATDQLRLIVRRYHHCFFLETLCRNQTKCSPDEGWICNWFDSLKLFAGIKRNAVRTKDGSAIGLIP